MIMKNSFKIYFFYSFTFFIILIISVITFEVILRSISVENKQEIYKKSTDFHHDYYPNSVFSVSRHKMDNYKTIINNINSNGIRGPEIIDKKNNQKRIILLGDSFIEADEISYNNSLGVKLSELVDKDKFSILQYGISSWSPLLYLNWINKKGLSFNPDSIIIFLCINDFHSISWGDSVYEKATKFDNNGLPISFNVSNENDKGNLFYPREIILRIKNFYNQYIKSDLPQLNQSDIDNLLNNEYTSDYDEYFKNNMYLLENINLTKNEILWGDAVNKNVNLTLDYLRIINKTLIDKEIELYITFVPLGWNIDLSENHIGRKKYYLEDVNLPMGGIYDKIIEFCNNEGINYLDIYNDIKIQAKNKDDFIYFPVDGHWTENGHDLVAKILYNKIIKN